MTEFFARHSGHEQVVLAADQASGLQAIIAIYSTALGPALGGTRFHPYQTEDAALTDVLNLSTAMAYKAALAGLALGGGKAVIIGDPTRDKSEQLLLAYGRFIQSLGGRYITACDVGTYSADMDIIARECDHVTGRTVENGGAGDSSILTAYGVFQGMLACAQHRWGTPTLARRRVGIAGVGKVGRRLIEHVLAEGAEVVVTDVYEPAVAEVRRVYPQVEVAPDADGLVRADIDVYAPCAMGGALDDATVAALRAKVICGGANNQLAHPGIEKMLDDRGILYAPDYLVNAGGIIQVADELEGFQFERAKARAARIFDTTRQVLELAADEGVPPSAAADRLAEHRMTDGARRRPIWLPGS